MLIISEPCARKNKMVECDAEYDLRSPFFDYAPRLYLPGKFF
jgi:hypothetical protein